jgi:hypothetical protein
MHHVFEVQDTPESSLPMVVLAGVATTDHAVPSHFIARFFLIPDSVEVPVAMQKVDAIHETAFSSLEVEPDGSDRVATVQVEPFQLSAIAFFTPDAV